MDRDLQSQTIGGLPVILQGYDGDLTMVYHGLSLATQAGIMTTTSINTTTNSISG